MANVLLGVTGGIAAYKSVYLVRLLKTAGHNVKVIMTEAATRFVGSLTFDTLSGEKVYVAEFETDFPLAHIELAKWADIFVIAPMTANTAAKIAHGIADNLLTSTVLATDCPILLAPAMNNKMYLNTATQANFELLKKRGFHFADPSIGMLACGDFAVGKMDEPDSIFAKIIEILTPKTASGLKILVTAGPTVEQIDPVRFISNNSSGKMGYAIAEAAKNAGAEVTLISGPVNLISRCNLIKVKSAEDMYNAVIREKDHHDILIMSAAVADYAPAETALQKIKKHNEGLNIQLKKTKDILKEASINKKVGQVYIGFAAESENVVANAKKKLLEKNLDLIVANDISRKDIGFDADDNEVEIIGKDFSDKISKRSKKEIAEIVIAQGIKLYKEKSVRG